jgi:hypothetical protein
MSAAAINAISQYQSENGGIRRLNGENGEERMSKSGGGQA